MIFPRESCADLSAARTKEWLETNGIGGFASSTIVGMNTRRYHGLLVAATRPPVGRLVLLSRIEERLAIGEGWYDLATNQYPGVIHPQGFQRQIEFRSEPFPVFTYRVGDVELEKTLFMVHGENSTVVRYRLREGPRDGIHLELRFLVALRDYHSLTHDNPALNPTVHSGAGWHSVEPYPGLPRLYINHAGGEFHPGHGWYYRFQYEEERARGLDWEEDLFHPFSLGFDLSGGTADVIASTGVRDASSAQGLQDLEEMRRETLLREWRKSDPLVQQLVRAADQFLVSRDFGLRTIIAGYPWFTDWGRDTMIALPGLMAATRRFEDARKILLAFSRHCDRGMLPNRFPDAGEEPEYNTVDASLWFFQAIYALVQRSGDHDFVKKNLYAVLLDILDWHRRGMRHGIRVDDDGLLRAGEPGVQLTWMDAKVGNRVVTPRVGKPVEIQALWYNTLRVAEHLAQVFGDTANAKRIEREAAQAKRSFNLQFWNPQAGCLYDCIDGTKRDVSIRPNQILAVSLPFSMLSRERMRGVVATVTRDLLTPFGLRSLSPRDPAYCAVYEGDPARRDASYHQGTVWAWLMGPYITALLRSSGGGPRIRKRAMNLLAPFREHLREAGIGSVSEIFDGDPPHAPKGCIAQAWSVAELLRAAIEDLGLFRK